MSKTLLLFLFGVASFATTARPTAAQTDSSRAPAANAAPVMEVRLSDGSVLYGTIERVAGDTFVLRTVSGVPMELRADQIKSQQRAAGSVVGGEYWPEDPNHTRLLFTSTGRALGKGQGYVSAYFLFFPMVAYGVTDRFTIAAGTPVIPGAIGEVFYVAPKLTVSQRERSAISVGALAFALPNESDEGTFGIVYSAGTWGTRDRAITAGAGWGFEWGGEQSSMSNAPVLVLGGETRVSRRVKLLTENWIFPNGAGGFTLVSGAVRFIGERLSTDFGLMGAAQSGAGCCFPMVNFVWNFGRDPGARQ
jgi:hypothetical protein